MSDSFENFKQSLELANSLKRIERRSYTAIPKSKNQPEVKGLRGGAAVLMVAAFEFYLRNLFEEHLTKLNGIPRIVDFDKLPKELRVQTYYSSLNRAMSGNPFERKGPKVDRLNSIHEACALIISKSINPNVFNESGNNPNSNSVKLKFKNVGIGDIFSKIKPRFETKLGSPVANTYISDKLDEIVNTRHVVAHTANALNISRKSQNEALRFLKMLAELLDKELDKHIKHLLNTCKI